MRSMLVLIPLIAVYGYATISTELLHRDGNVRSARVLALPPQDPCEPTRYELDTYRGHAETPEFKGVDTTDHGAVTKFINDSMCWADVSNGDPSIPSKYHALYQQGETVAQFEANVTPERRAFNIARADLRQGPHIVARVSMRRTGQNTTTDFFVPRQYKVGMNYLLLSDDDLGTHVQIIYEDGSISAYVAESGTLTDHGHFPRNRKKLVPPFSDGLSECTKAKDRSACFVDDPNHHIVTPTVKIVAAGTQFHALAVAAENTTATWVKLNGTCYCQGSGCH